MPLSQIVKSQTFASNLNSVVNFKEFGSSKTSLIPKEVIKCLVWIIFVPIFPPQKFIKLKIDLYLSKYNGEVTIPFINLS
jgi:hypothetical protein